MLDLLRELGVVREEKSPLECGICQCGNWDHDHARIDGEWDRCLALNLKTGVSCQCPGYKRWMGGDNCEEIG